MRKSVLICLLLSAFGLSSCGKNEYPADAVSNFMVSCSMTSGGDTRKCSCLMDKVQKKYTFKEFSGIDMQMRAGSLDPNTARVFGELAAECAK